MSDLLSGWPSIVVFVLIVIIAKVWTKWFDAKTEKIQVRMDRVQPSIAPTPRQPDIHVRFGESVDTNAAVSTPYDVSFGLRGSTISMYATNGNAEMDEARDRVYHANLVLRDHVVNIRIVNAPDAEAIHNRTYGWGENHAIMSLIQNHPDHRVRESLAWLLPPDRLDILADVARREDAVASLEAMATPASVALPATPSPRQKPRRDPMAHPSRVLDL